MLYGLDEGDIHGMVVRFYNGQVNVRYQNQTVKDSYAQIKNELEGKERVVPLFSYDEHTGELKEFSWDQYLRTTEEVSNTAFSAHGPSESEA